MKCIVGFGLIVLLPCAAEAASLPKRMLGVWATDPAACSEQASEIKMTVEPRTVLMYEVAYTVKRIVRLRDGFLRVSGDSVTDDGRAPHSVLLKLVGDKLQVGKTDGQIYRRCPKSR